MNGAAPPDQAGRDAEIAVVGAGLAGTVLAIACRQAGLNVRLYDSGTGQGAAHTLLELTANGTRVLHALGLKQRLADIALTPAFTTIRNARSGFLLSQRPLGAFSDARYGAPCYLIEAATLQQALWQTCAAEQIAIERGATVSGIDTDTGLVTFNDDTSAQHLAVAVATGAPNQTSNEPLADLLEQRNWQIAKGITVIRARARRRDASRDHDRFINTWLLSGGYCVERPLPASSGAEQTVELTAVVAAPRPELPADSALAELLGGSHPHLRTLVEAQHSAVYVEVPGAPIAEYWHAGRTVLLGGACHAPQAYSDLIPSAAMEDAWILSRMMERWEEEPHQDFAEYERFRKPRARRLRAFAAAQLQAQTLSEPARIWRRNLQWSLTSRFLPEIAMQRLDWLYGYDCIKGFV